MAIQCEMTWTKSNRWTRMHDGQRFYVGCKVLRSNYPTLFVDTTKLGSYLAANAWWADKEATLRIGERAGVVSIKPPRDLLHNPKALAARQAKGEKFVVVPVTEVQQAETIGMAIAAMLRSKQLEAEAKGISCGRWNNLKLQLSHFENWKGSNASIVLTGADLIDYRNKLLADVDRKEFESGHAANCLVTLKQFCRWLWTTERVDTLPRNIDTIEPIPNVPKKIKPMKPEEFRVLIENCSERTKLYLLLMLNCGMTQVDISDLKPEQVDWTEGRIIRRRSKTEDKDVPEVNYKLWKPTFDLLKKFGSKTGVRVLTNDNGGDLKVEKIVNGKLRKVDNFASAYSRLRVKLKKKGIVVAAAKTIKKGGSTKLKSNPLYRDLRFYYLGQASKTIADKHYAGESDDLFDEALEWLRVEFGVK